MGIQHLKTLPLEKQKDNIRYEYLEQLFLETSNSCSLGGGSYQSVHSGECHCLPIKFCYLETCRYPLIHIEDGDSVTVTVCLKGHILFLCCLSQQRILPEKESSSINKNFTGLQFVEENSQKEPQGFAFWQV